MVVSMLAATSESDVEGRRGAGGSSSDDNSDNGHGNAAQPVSLALLAGACVM